MIYKKNLVIFMVTNDKNEDKKEKDTVWFWVGLSFQSNWQLYFMNGCFLVSVLSQITTGPNHRQFIK